MIMVVENFINCRDAMHRVSTINKIFNSELRTQNSELRTQNSELRTQNSELRTQNSELRTLNSELRTETCIDRRRRSTTCQNPVLNFFCIIFSTNKANNCGLYFLQFKLLKGAPSKT